MTTKEEKARLKSIRTTLTECVSEIDVILGEEDLKEFISAKVKKEHTPKGADSKDVGLAKTDVMKIGDLNIGDTGIIVEGEILEMESSEGTTKKGKDYKVTKITLSDKSGPIKLVLWNEQTEQADGLEPHDIIRVEAWKVEKGYKGGVFELVYGQYGTINKVNIERHIL